MGVGKGSILAEAEIYNELPLKSVIQGTREAAILDRKVKEAEIDRNEKETQKVEREDKKIVTPEELEDERYR